MSDDLLRVAFAEAFHTTGLTLASQLGDLALAAMRVLADAPDEVLAEAGLFRIGHWEYARAHGADSPAHSSARVVAESSATHRRPVGPWMKMERADAR